MRYGLTNMVGDRRETGTAANRRAKPKQDSIVRLGDMVRRLLEEQICVRRTKLASVAEAWARLLPVGLGQHCHLEEISGGQLKVLVDSPPYMHELRLCSTDLLREIQKQCPQARIKKIKFMVGPLGSGR